MTRPALKSLVAFLLTCCVVAGTTPCHLWAQTKAASPAEQEAYEAADRLEQQIARIGKRDATDRCQKRALAPLSFRNFVRGALATGNLIQVPYVNNGNISGRILGRLCAASIYYLAQRFQCRLRAYHEFYCGGKRCYRAGR